MLRISHQDESNLRARIVEVLEKHRTEIVERYYEEYCIYVSSTGGGNADIRRVINVCTPVKARFLLILDRFIEMLRDNTEEYNLDESERDQEYALRFVVPGRRRAPRSHDIIRMTEAFVKIATKQVLDELSQIGYPMVDGSVASVMERLIYITFEDLWVSSVVAFSFQHSMIRQLLLKLLTRHEEERQKLWGEIHDEFLQALAVIPLKLEIIEKLSQEDVPSMKKELSLTKAIARKAIREIRDFGQGYNLFWVERRSFIFNLKRFIRFFEQRFKITVTLELGLDVKRRITGFAAIALFRIIQEALYNTGKHSRASYPRMNINVVDRQIVALVEDNGIGFDVRDIRLNSIAFRHFGLAFMKERASMLAGFLKIDSARGSGTRIIISIPLETFSTGRPMQNSGGVDSETRV